MLPDNGVKVSQEYNWHMTLTEWKLIMQHVKSTCSLKWFVYLSLLSFRGMRPQEALAVNIVDFSDDYKKLTWRECKTNKMRIKEHLIPDLSNLIKTYVMLNKYSLKDGYLFPYYKVRVHGKPYTDSYVAAQWFIREVRNKLKKKYLSFDEHYLIKTEKGMQIRYRIGLYSFRRFFETYIYLHNSFAPMSTALIKELMEYNSRFDPLKHYIKVCHQEEEKVLILETTLGGLSQLVIKGQKTIGEYGT